MKTLYYLDRNALIPISRVTSHRLKWVNKPKGEKSSLLFPEKTGEGPNFLTSFQSQVLLKSAQVQTGHLRPYVLN